MKRQQIPGQLEIQFHEARLREVVHTYDVLVAGMYESRSLTWVRWECSCGASAHDETLWSDEELARRAWKVHAQ